MALTNVIMGDVYCGLGFLSLFFRESLFLFLSLLFFCNIINHRGRFCIYIDCLHILCIQLKTVLTEHVEYKRVKLLYIYILHSFLHHHGQDSYRKFQSIIMHACKDNACILFILCSLSTIIFTYEIIYICIDNIVIGSCYLVTNYTYYYGNITCDLLLGNSTVLTEYPLLLQGRYLKSNSTVRGCKQSSIIIPFGCYMCNCVSFLAILRCPVNCMVLFCYIMLCIHRVLIKFRTTCMVAMQSCITIAVSYIHD